MTGDIPTYFITQCLKWKHEGGKEKILMRNN